jgi:hypothetical protein
LLLVMMLGLLGPSQVAAIGSIAVVLGGIVSLGSNVSTLRQTIAAISDAEALRSELIGRIDLRVVGDGLIGMRPRPRTPGGVRQQAPCPDSLASRRAQPLRILPSR